MATKVKEINEIYKAHGEWWHRVTSRSDPEKQLDLVWQAFKAGYEAGEKAAR